MKKRVLAIALSAALAISMMIGLTAVSYAADPVIKGNYNTIVITGLDDSLSYGVEIKTSQGMPTTTDGVKFYDAFQGKLLVGYGTVKPNKTYYLYMCSREGWDGPVSEWKEYKVKTSSVPVPSVSKIVVGKGSMTVKVSTKLDSGTKYTVQWSAKGVAKQTKTFSVSEDNWEKPSFKIKGLKKGKKYTVKVKAKTYEGYTSAWSKSKTSGKIK